MSAVEWIEASDDRGGRPAQLAALERAAFGAYPDVLEAMDRETRAFAAEAAAIAAAHDQATLTAQLADQRTLVASRLPSIVRGLIAITVLFGPVIAFALVVVRRAFPLAESVEVGGAMQLVAGAAAMVALVGMLVDRRPLGLPQRVLDGAAVVAILTVVVALWLTSASPEIAGRNAAIWIAADAAGALAIVGLDIAERLAGRKAESAFEHATVVVRSRLAAYDRELAAAYEQRFDAVARAVDALPDQQRRAVHDDRDAALERLVSAGRMPRGAADHGKRLRLGELSLHGALVAMSASS